MKSIMKKPKRKIRKAKCSERKIKTVTETGWAVWLVTEDGADCFTKPWFSKGAAINDWLDGIDFDVVSIGHGIDNWIKARKFGYRCLRTTAKGEL